jgi:hypothetical protein
MSFDFDTTGLQSSGSGRWVAANGGDIVTLAVLDGPPNLPAPLTELARLRHDLAVRHAVVGCLVDAEVIAVDRLPALLEVVKTPRQGAAHGLTVAGTLTVPRAQRCMILRREAHEHGTTGVREALIALNVGSSRMMPPHPYAPEVKGLRPYLLSDGEEFDGQIPQHPLSRVRAWLRYVAPTVRLDAEFLALPPFGDDTASPRGTRRRRWFRRA